MDWIAIDVHIAGDAVTHRLADAFRLRVAEAAGLLTLAFAGMAQHAQDGNLATVTDSQLESWAVWQGKRGAFAAFFRAQLCDDVGTVRAWEKYNGAAIREAKAARKRMQDYRAKKKAERSANGTQNGTQNGTANGTRDVRHNLTRPDLTGPEQQVTTSPPEKPAAIRRTVKPPTSGQPDPFPKPICDAGYEAFVARIGAVEYPRFRKALLPVYRSPGAAHPTAEQLVQAVEAFAESREAAEPRWRGTFTVEKFGQGLHEFVRLGAMPLNDEWGEWTERGRAAGLASA